MEIYQEPIHYQNPSLCMKVWKFEDGGKGSSSPIRLWHYHKEVEFVLVLEGSHEIHTPNKVYALNPGDVVVVGSSQLHAGRKVDDGNVSIIVLHVDLQPYFDPAMMMYYRHFSEIHRPLDELNYMFREDEQVRSELAQIITRIYDEIWGKAKGYEIAASMHIKHILLTLLRGDRRGLLEAHEYVDASVMQPVLNYVDKHLAERIDMERVSRDVGMSYSYFSKYFKRAMGVSFTDYVNRKRIAEAERLLVTRSMSVTEIAGAVGIENMAHFYELFKRYKGCTPKQYIKRLTGGTD